MGGVAVDRRVRATVHSRRSFSTGEFFEGVSTELTGETITVAGVAVWGGGDVVGCDVEGRGDDGLGDVGAERQGVTVELVRWLGDGR